MSEILILILVSILFSLFILFPKNLLIFNNKKDQNNLDILLFENIVIFLSVIAFFSIIRLDLYISIPIIFFFLLCSVYKNLFNFFLCVKNNIKKIIFIFFLIIVFNFEIANNLLLGFDGQAIWFKKAYFIKNNLDPLNTIFPNYPFLGSYLWSFFWQLSFLEYEYYGRFIYNTIFIFIFICFFSYHCKNKSNLIYLLSTLIILYIFNKKFLFNGYQDALVFSLLLVLIHYLVCFLKDGLTRDLIYFFATIFILTWIKNEAQIYCLIILSVLLIYKIKDKNLNIILLMIIFTFFHKFLIYEFYYNIPMSFQAGNYNLNDFLNLKFNLKDIIYIFISFLKVFMKNIIILITIPSILYYFSNKNKFSYKEKKIINFIFLNFILFSFAIFAFYLFTTLPLIWHISTSLERLIFQISAVLIYPIFVIFGKVDDLKKIVKS